MFFMLNVQHINIFFLPVKDGMNISYITISINTLTFLMAQK